MLKFELVLSRPSDCGGLGAPLLSPRGGGPGIPYGPPGPPGPGGPFIGICIPPFIALPFDEDPDTGGVGRPARPPPPGPGDPALPGG